MLTVRGWAWKKEIELWAAALDRGSVSDWAPALAYELGE
jgi:hypothetical protein